MGGTEFRVTGGETRNGKGGPVLAATYSPAGLRVRGDQIFRDTTAGSPRGSVGGRSLDFVVYLLCSKTSFIDAVGEANF